jgi:hypothetical protein
MNVLRRALRRATN